MNESQRSENGILKKTRYGFSVKTNWEVARHILTASITPVKQVIIIRNKNT